MHPQLDIAMALTYENARHLEFLVTTLRYRSRKECRTKTRIYEENPKFKLGNISLIKIDSENYLREYIKQLFEELQSFGNTVTFKTLIIVFTGLHELKWYLIAKFKYHREINRRIVSLLTLIHQKPLNWLKDIVLSSINELMNNDFSEKDTVGIVNAVSLFDRPENRTEEYHRNLDLGYIEGPSDAKLELLELLSRPKFLNANKFDSSTKINLEKTVKRTCRLTIGTNIDSLELTLLILSTYPDCQQWYDTLLKQLGRVMNVNPYQMLEEKGFYWTELILYRHVPLYLSYKALDEISTDQVLELSHQRKMIEQLLEEIKQLKRLD